MDHSDISAGAFHNLADRYRDKFMDLTMYDEFYSKFCDLLPQGRARVLDAACGPGNVARFLMARRPELDLLGIDLAPRMVELARQAVPPARFLVHDCRRLTELGLRFDGIICAFGLPYLLPEEALAFIRAAGEVLDSGGTFYVSTMLGDSQESGLTTCSSGEPVYVHYHGEESILGSLEACGFGIISRIHLPSPSSASKPTNDLIVISKK
jgi:SAM-dependent methyltransferase